MIRVDNVTTIFHCKDVFLSNLLLCLTNLLMCFSNLLMCFSNLLMCFSNLLMCFSNLLMVSLDMMHAHWSLFLSAIVLSLMSSILGVVGCWISKNRDIFFASFLMLLAGKNTFRQSVSGYLYSPL